MKFGLIILLILGWVGCSKPIPVAKDKSPLLPGGGATTATTVQCVQGICTTGTASTTTATITPDGVIQERFVDRRVDLTGCLKVSFKEAGGYEVKHEWSREIEVWSPGVAVCTVDTKP